MADRHGYQRFVTQQIYYSLQSRDAEYELVPLAVDQDVGILVWSPLAGGLLSGKFRRGVDGPAGSRAARAGQSAAADPPALAPGQDGRRPARGGRPRAAGAVPRGNERSGGTTRVHSGTCLTGGGGFGVSIFAIVRDPIAAPG